MIGVQPLRILVNDGPVLVCLSLHGVHHLCLELPHGVHHLLPGHLQPALPAPPLVTAEARVYG